MRDLSARDIAITGMGMVTAAGIGCEEFAGALRSGSSGIRQVSPDHNLGIAAGALLTGLPFEDSL